MIDVSGEAVRKAIASGRLVDSVRRDDKGRPSLDPDIALVEWKRNTNSGRGSASRGEGAAIPAPPAGPKTAARQIPKPDVSEPAAPAPARDAIGAAVAAWAGADMEPDFARRARAAERRADAGQDDQDDGAGDKPDLNNSRAWKEHYQSELARLQVEEKLGTLIDAKAAEERWSALIASCKTKLLAIPSKARSRLPKLDNSDVAMLEKLVREALEELTQ